MRRGLACTQRRLGVAPQTGPGLSHGLWPRHSVRALGPRPLAYLMVWTPGAFMETHAMTVVTRPNPGTSHSVLLRRPSPSAYEPHE